MAKKTSVRQEFQPANLSIMQIKAALPKLKRRLEELQAFNPEEAARDRSQASALKDKIDQTLMDVFGPSSIEYNRYRVYSLYSGGAIVIGSRGGPSPRELTEAYAKGNQEAITKLETALSMFREKISDVEGTIDGAAPFTLDGCDLHPALQAACGALYKNGHYAEAIETACKALNAQVQAKSGKYDQSETGLMEAVFSANKPILAFNALQDQSDQSEQQGMMFLYKGAFLAFRNPRAHKLVEDDPQTAFGVIRLIDFLIRMLEKAKF